MKIEGQKPAFAKIHLFSGAGKETRLCPQLRAHQYLLWPSLKKARQLNLSGGSNSIVCGIDSAIIAPTDKSLYGALKAALTVMGKKEFYDRRSKQLPFQIELKMRFSSTQV